MDKPFLNVVAAIVMDKYNNILITQRLSGSHLGGYWEFPGGQIEKGESEEQALIRELQEETGLDICIDRKFWEEEFDYDIKIIHLSFFLCHLCSPGQVVQRKEINDYHWIKTDALDNYKFPPADTSLINQLRKFLLEKK